jgi:hypothetical protein
MNRQRFVTALLLALAATLALRAGAARGAVLVYEIGIAFSTDAFGTLPAGSPPWIVATFDDGGGAGSVTLTLENVNLVGGEFTREWDFNLDPLLDPDDLLFSAPVKVGAFDDPTIDLEIDAHQAGGDGKYDIEFMFATSNAGGGIHRFGPGEKATYTITGIPTLTASSFEFLSAPGGGLGPFFPAAHIQGIALEEENASVWATTPEPSAIRLALVAASALAAVGFRRLLRGRRLHE